MNNFVTTARSKNYVVKDIKFGYEVVKLLHGATKL